MVRFNFTYDPSVTLEQRVGFELAAAIWSTYLTDDIVVSLHIGSSDSLGDGGSAVGGAIPMFHETNYGVYQAYAGADATISGGDEPATVDEQALASLQTGNTTDFVIDGQVVDGNTEILLTSAQAKALGMDEAIALQNGTTWERNLIETDGLDGYILIGSQHPWSYDYARKGLPPKDTLDFLSMAMHEIGHTLGFFSGIDGTLDTIELHSGQTQVEDFSVLDLYRHSLNAASVENPDGAVSDLTIGENSYFSIDGGITNLANFSTGIKGDGYQASHWKRLEKALGVMDPTLAYREQLTLNRLDLQAMDVLGYDIDYAALEDELDLKALRQQAEEKAALDLGLSATALSENRETDENGDRYDLSYSEWWQMLENQLLAMDYGELYQVFEIGYNKLLEAHQAQYGEKGALLSMDYGELYQALEAAIIEMDYGELYQAFEAELLSMEYNPLYQALGLNMDYGPLYQALGLNMEYGPLYQIFEQGYSKLFPSLEPLFATLDYVDNAENVIEAPTAIDFSGIPLFNGGENDDIIGGSAEQDRVDGGLGDDLIDGKAGSDLLSGNAGRDFIYGADGEDILYGGDGDDRLLGEDGDDQIFGEQGHDILAGGYGHDVLSGGTGDDDIAGASGHDVLAGGVGDDLLSGDAGSDLLMGEDGSDTLMGGAGNDILYGDEKLADTQAALNVLRQTLVNAAIAAGESSEATSIDAADFSDMDGFIRIEAEKFSLSGGFYVEKNGLSSGDRTIATGGSSNMASALANFSGPTGRYMVVVKYLDESDGQARATVNIGGETVDSWQFSQDNNQFINRTVATNIEIQAGDVIEILGIRENNEFAQIDYVDFIPLDNILTTSAESAASTSLLINSEFNSGLVGWTNAEELNHVEDADTGNEFLQLNSSGSGTGQTIQLDSGGLYTFNADVLATGSGWNGFGITFMDENWNAVEDRTYSTSSDEWTTQGDTFLVSPEARHASVWFHKSNDDGEFLIDNVFLTLETSTNTSSAETITEDTPALNNTGFENAIGGDGNWKIWSGTGVALSATDAYEGNSLVLNENVDGGQTLDVVAGELYELNFAAKTTAAQAWKGIGVSFYDVNGETIIQNSYQVSSDVWTEYSQKIVSPEGAVRAGVWFVSDGVAGTFSLDNVSFSVVEDRSAADSSLNTSQEGLLAYFSLDEANTALVNSVDGTSLLTYNIDEENRIEGKSGSALQFKALDESIRIEAGQQLQSGVTDDVTDADFAVAFWMRPDADANGTFRNVVSKWSSGRSMGVWLDDNSNRLSFELTTTSSLDTSNLGQTELELHRWSHVTFMKSGQKLSLYVNGQLDTSVTLHGQALMPEGILEVGKSFQGAVDDIYLYNKSIDLADIHTLSGYQADRLVGGIGDDQLFGGEGDDTLDGTDGVSAGRAEIDILSGGSGRDRFILGNESTFYYLSDNGLSDGSNQDYATITDFELGVDVVQLHGSEYEYRTRTRQDSFGVYTELSHGKDVIAAFRGVEGLDLSTSSFEFVG